MLHKLITLLILASLSLSAGIIVVPPSITETPVIYSPASDFTYTTNNSEITITSYIGAGGTVNIPPNINGFPVVVIGSEAFRNNSTISGIYFPTTLRDIYFASFYNMVNLRNIYISSGLTNIGVWAFGNTSLVEVEIPNTVISIDINAFNGNPYTTNMVFGSSLSYLGANSLYGCNGVFNDGKVSFCFKGNAPTLGSGVWGDTRPKNKILRTRSATGFGTPPDLFGGLPTAYWDPSEKHATIITKAYSEPVMEDPALTNGLVLWMKMDEQKWTGAVGEVKDSSGLGNNGTSYGGAQTNPGKINRSGYFDGVGGYVNAGNNASINPQTFTLSVWVYKKANNSYAGIIAGANDGYMLYTGAGGGSVALELDCVGGAWNIYYGATLENDVWTHITVSRVFNTGTINFYKNGILTYTVNGLTNTIALATKYIGYSGLGGRFFCGSIDDVRIYNRALSSNEVTRLYNMREKEKKPMAVYQGTKLCQNLRKLSYVRQSADVWQPTYALVFDPQGFTPYETDYVDSNIPVTIDTELRMLVYITGKNPSGYPFCGVYTTATDKFALGYSTPLTESCFQFSTQNSEYKGIWSTGWHWVALSKTGGVIDETLYSFSGTPTSITANTIYIGASNNNNTPLSGVTTAWDYSRIQIIKNGKLVQDLQAQSGGYFYDTVSKSNFYSKAGTTFAVTNITGSILPSQNWK